MTVIHAQLRHHVGHDPAIVRLREKYYSRVPAQDVPCPESGDVISRFTLIDESEAGIAFRCLTHPSSYFSPSLPDTQSWPSSRWGRLVRGMFRCPAWDVARFNMLTADQASALRKAAARSGMGSTVNSSLWPVVMGGRTFGEYVASRRSSFNANQRRCRRLMEKEGFEFSESLDIQQILSVYEARNCIKGEDDYSVLAPFKGFLTELRTEMQAAGRWLEVGVVRAGKLEAFVIGFWDQEGIFYCFQTSYNPEHRALRLGAMCFERILEIVLNAGAKHVSFMGDSSYFNQFTQDYFQFQMVDVFRHSPKGWILLGRRVLSRLRKALLALREGARERARAYLGKSEGQGPEQPKGAEVAKSAPTPKSAPAAKAEMAPKSAPAPEAEQPQKSASGAKVAPA